MLPEFNSEGDEPAGAHLVDWEGFHARFGVQTPRRVWLFGRLRALIELSATTGKLLRVSIWGGFVTAKSAPRDIDVLLIMNDDFEVEKTLKLAQQVFDSTRAKLQFESDVFWARASIGEEVLALWLETYQMSRAFKKRGIVELDLP